VAQSSIVSELSETTSEGTEPLGECPRSVRADVCSVYFNTHRLRDHLDGQDEPRAVAFAHEATGDAFEGTMDHLDGIAFLDEGYGVELELALDESSDPVNLVLRQRCQFAAERDNSGHQRAALNAHVVVGIESSEAITGKERPVDGLLAILPSTPARDGGQKDLDAARIQLIAHGLLGAGTRANGKPGW
jgi:hypothetical protein